MCFSYIMPNFDPDRQIGEKQTKNETKTSFLDFLKKFDKNLPKSLIKLNLE